MEKSEIIRNPLTLIAIFAGLSEVSMTAVLPLLSAENQGIFMWFVMIYPTLLVCGFFYILICRREALYAPSDFKDDATWLEVMRNQERKILEKYPVERAVAPRSEIEYSNSVADVESNRFFVLLKTLGATPDNIKSIMLSTDNVDDVPEIVSAQTANKSTSEKLKRVLTDFPSSKDDFYKLKTMLQGGN